MHSSLTTSYIITFCLGQPTVSPSFSSVAALMGIEVVITFAIQNAHPPVETGDISWRFTRIGYFIHIIEELERNDPRLSRDRLSLTLKNISDDQGNYTMTATNSAGSGTGTTYLDLESKIIIRVHRNYIYQECLTLSFHT